MDAMAGPSAGATASSLLNARNKHLWQRAPKGVAEIAGALVHSKLNGSGGEQEPRTRRASVWF